MLRSAFCLDLDKDWRAARVLIDALTFAAIHSGGVVIFKRTKNLWYKCNCCGVEFTGSPSFGFEIPPLVWAVPEDEREGRVLIGSDLCRIRLRANEDSDEDTFLIRANLEVPIRGVLEPFSWGVWVTQSQQSFIRYLETYDEDQSEEVSFGWLPITMAYYRDFEPLNFDGNLACDVHWGPKGQRPTIQLHECDHQFYLDQANGIDWDKAVTIAQECMQGSHNHN